MIWSEGSCLKNIIFEKEDFKRTMKSYFIFRPSVQGRIGDEWNQCLIQMTRTIKDGYRPLKLNVFLSVTEDQEYLNARQIILGSIVNELKDKSPAVSVTVHPPYKPWKVSVEALFLIPGYDIAATRFYESMPYVVINNRWGKEVWGAGSGSGFFSGDIRKASENAFDHAVSLLAAEGMTLNNIIRQWNYVGNILAIRNGLQHYQVFNEVRSEYYARYRTVTGYPAATGIGLKSESVIIDFCAVMPDATVKISGLSNPDQVNAYEYDQKVLKGIKEPDKTKKQPPQFERALIIASEGKAVLYVSGTASIKGQETKGKNNVKEQTLVTLENITRLSEAGRINQTLPESSEYSLNYSLLRVYIKRQEDFDIVRSVCEERLPGIPMIFIEADVCRNDLLVEIEAEVQIHY